MMATKAPLLSQELKVAMKDLRLGQLLATLPERILLAEKGAMPLQDFLLGLFNDEVQRRRGAAASRRADHAGLDPDMVFERWDKSAKVSLDRRVLQELSSHRFVDSQRNVVILGPVGVGKTIRRQCARPSRLSFRIQCPLYSCRCVAPEPAAEPARQLARGVDDRALRRRHAHHR
jgi:hypothetical protein